MSTKTNTETRTIREWMRTSPEPLTVIREGEVLLIHDGMVWWAADPAEFEAAMESDLTLDVYADEWDEDRAGRDPVNVTAYTHLCQNVPGLSSDDPRVVAACEAHNIDPEALYG